MSLDALYFPSLTETWKSSNRNTKIKIKLLMFFLCYYMRVSNGNMGLSNGNLPRLLLKNFKYWSTFVFNVLSKKFVSTQARFQDEFIRPKSTWRRMAGFSGSCGRRWSDPRKMGCSPPRSEWQPYICFFSVLLFSMGLLWYSHLSSYSSAKY